MYHEFMVILKFPMANFHYFRQFMATMDAQVKPRENERYDLLIRRLVFAPPH